MSADESNTEDALNKWLNPQQVQMFRNVASIRGISIEDVVNQFIVESMYRKGEISLRRAAKFLGMTRYKTAKLFKSKTDL